MIPLIIKLLKDVVITFMTEQIEELLADVMDYLKPRHFTLNVSLPHLAMLRWLDRAGPISVSAAAQFADVSQSAITQAAQKLESKGYVRRTRDRVDQRVVNISLTDTGQHEVQGFKEMQRSRLQTLLAPLKDEEQLALRDILYRLTEPLPTKGRSRR